MPSKKEQNATQRLLELISYKGHTEDIKEDKAESEQDASFSSKPSEPQLGAPKNPVVGVDLKNGSIRIVVCSKLKSGYALHAWLQEDCPHALGTEQLVSQLQSALSRILKKTLKKKAAKPKIWVTADFSIEEFHLITIPKVNKKQIPWTLIWTLQREGQANLEDSLLDFEIIGEIVEKGVTKMRVLAVLLAKKEVNQIQKAFEKSGYKLSGMTSSSLALLNFFRSGCIDCQAQNRSVIHVEDDGSRIDIFQNNNLLMHRKVRTGLNSIVEEYHNAQGISMQAEKEQEDALQKTREDFFNLLEQKEEDEAETVDNNIQEAIDSAKPAYLRLIRQVERSFSYHTRTLGYAPVEKVYLAGHLAAMKQVKESFAQELGLEVQILNAFSGNIRAICEPPESLSEKILLSSAIGLSLSESSNVLNFIDTYQDKLRHKKEKNIWLASTATVFSLLFLLSGFEVWQVLRLQSKQQLVEDRKQELLERERRVQDLNQRLQEIEKDLKQINYQQLQDLLQDKKKYWDRYALRFKPLAVIGSFLSIMPENVSINEIYTYFQHGKKDRLEFIKEKSSAEKNSQPILYSDKSGWFKLRIQKDQKKPEVNLSDNVLVVNGVLNSEPDTLHLAVANLEQKINKSPFFQVLYTFDEEHIYKNFGNCLQFRFIIKIS